jgi:hypothetical protein
MHSCRVNQKDVLFVTICRMNINPKYAMTCDLTSRQNIETLQARPMTCDLNIVAERDEV